MSEEQKTLRVFAIIEAIFAVICLILGIVSLFLGNTRNAVAAIGRAFVLAVIFYFLMLCVKDATQYKMVRFIFIIDIFFSVIAIITNIVAKSYQAAFSNMISGGISFFLLTVVNEIRKDAEK